ncbi:SrmB Superfamily II DNA and RNA helicases [Microbacteriaceae bacterium]
MVNEDLSAAERYARAKVKQTAPSYNSFLELLDFALDPFQEQACHALAKGKGVLVAAPTGAGKTIVGEFAIHLAIEKNQKVFYTTPIKALSNQKFAELVARYGPERVGLLTGDTNTNSDAQIVVMTTEVLRNMIYANSDSLIELGFVVMDEVHYLADRFRGAVWEEVILHLPKDVKLVSLSATVSNAEEFGAWLEEVRGDTEIVVSEHRPVPLDQHVLFGDELMELFAAGSKNQRVNAELVQKHSSKLRIPIGKYTKGKKPKGELDGRFSRIPKISKPEVVEILEDNDLLPAIFFIFSRVGCDAAVRACHQYGVRLTTREEQAEIRYLVEEKTASIADEDLATLGYFEWLSGLERGVAAHHAGMLPAFKEVVEELFLRKLVRVVFATETLALGINMPARTVVLERLDKFNGESRVQITPGEYTQLTGRAGRRGIDTLGHSVIQWSGNLDPASVAGLASKRSYPLISPFKPTANMAVNLIEAFGRKRAREVLETSFAQFQADRSVVGLAKGIREKQISLDGYAKSMECHLGDFFGYSSIRRELSDIEKSLASGRTRQERGKDIRQTKGRSAQERKLAELKVRMKTHPCHLCSHREAHSRWAERWWQLHRETQAILDQIEGRTNLVASTFDKICELLIELDYLDDSDQDLQVTESGKMLARIYGERDLLVAEALRLKIWDNLDAPSLAAMAAALVYEPRRDDENFEPRAVKGNFQQSFTNTQLLWDDLENLAKKHKLPRSSKLEMDLSYPIHRWATGAKLDLVLESADLLPGDFIRWCKQIIDLLEQLAKASEGPISAKARDAVDLVKRGIVAYSYYA